MSRFSTAMPVLLINNRQRAVSLDLALIRRCAGGAVPLCAQHVGRGEAVWPGLAEVEVALVSDRVIAQIHRRFLNVPGATDVITFAHGELVVSAATAARQARELGEIIEREVVRYTVHGLLHLNGYEDGETRDAAEMWRVQEEIVEAVWPPERRFSNEQTA